MRHGSDKAQFDLSDSEPVDAVSAILDVAVEVLTDYCGEGQQRIVRMARWIVRNMGTMNFTDESVFVSTTKNADLRGDRKVTVYISDDLTPVQAREAAAAMIWSADEIETEH